MGLGTVRDRHHEIPRSRLPGVHGNASRVGDDDCSLRAARSLRTTKLRLAGIGADDMAVAGQLGEALSGLVGRYWSVVDLAADGSLEHGRVDEGGFGSVWPGE